ncbi:phospholipase D zeta 1-like protein, partial [Tanacetum coccineum]
MFNSEDDKDLAREMDLRKLTNDDLHRNEAPFVIYETGWWLYPELYLKHPFRANASSRLDALFEAKAKESVKVLPHYMGRSQKLDIESKPTNENHKDMTRGSISYESPSQDIQFLLPQEADGK